MNNGTEQISNRPQYGGWAPGMYISTCLHCGKQFTGDKRAISCSKCAYSSVLNIMFNGPPKVGKDYCALAVARAVTELGLTVQTFTFADALHKRLYTKYPFWHDVYTRDLKDEPCSLLEGKTPREVLIEFNNATKAIEGTDTFLKDTMTFLDNSSADVRIITDLGYVYEADYMAMRGEEYIVVQLTDGESNYDNDNRAYQFLEGHTIRYHNLRTKPIEELVKQIFQACPGSNLKK